MSLNPHHPGLPTPSTDAAEQERRQHWRFMALVFILVIAGVFIVLRLFQYQLVNWIRFDPQSALPASGLSQNAPRGVIVDRDGELLAADRFRYQVIADPSLIPQEQWAEVAYWLQGAAGIPAAETWQILVDRQGTNYALLAKDLDLTLGEAFKEAKDADLMAAEEAIEEAATRGVDRETTLANLKRSPVRYLTMRPAPSRYYPQNEVASQVVGFVNTERQGFYGLEGYYNLFLRADGVGLPKGRVEGVESLSPQVRTLVPSTTGKDLVLTLDRTVQWIIEEELRDALSFYRAEAGTIIVMNPKTGAILGLANLPTYDPNRYDQYSDYLAFRDSAISAQYEPGSIYKIITMAAAIDTGTVKPTDIFTDTGSISVGGRIIQNSSRTAMGQVSVTDALALSLNVVTAQVAEKLGAEAFYKYVDLFGFGQSTEIDLFGEMDGLVKSPGDPTWSQADLGTNSFGQGLAVTPIQMINAAAAIANGGTLMRPYIVQARVEGDRVLQTQSTVVRRVLSPESAATMTEMMIHTVEFGNSRAKVPGYSIAGKSGTAEIPSPEGYLEDETIVSFVGFVPADDPQFVLLVKMDRPDPKISPWATYTAAPVFARVTIRLLEHLNIPPDSVRLGE
ncbi:MAG: penicillin-binding protein 2 [Caldilineaceae bacterium]|nr:penicillin-binding protein 2 [Caldilineaceae bacterium]MBP8109124.1 penicillin-binding protein 2 [Caldilineaceae bacterium]MBP8123443.1 penicillin-binding protein 2 [Caldilineaceae bacterium]